MPNLPCMVRFSADMGEMTIPIPHIIIMHSPSKFGLKSVVESKLPITEMVIMHAKDGYYGGDNNEDCADKWSKLRHR